MSLSSSLETTHCLEINITKVSGVPGQGTSSHFQAVARFSQYPPIKMFSTEGAGRQAAATTFFFNVAHRCRFITSPDRLLQVKPLEVCIDIMRAGMDGLTPVGTAHVPLRLLGRPPSGRPQCRSVSLFDSYNKYAGMVEVDASIYPEGATSSTSEGTQPAPAPPARGVTTADGGSVAAVTMPGGTVFVPPAVTSSAAHHDPHPQPSLASDGSGPIQIMGASGQPYVLRVVVDSAAPQKPASASASNAASSVANISGPTADTSTTSPRSVLRKPSMLGSVAAANSPSRSSTVAVDGGHVQASNDKSQPRVAKRKTILHILQYDVYFQLKSVCETLIAALKYEDSRLSAAAYHKKDAVPRRLASCVSGIYFCDALYKP